MVLVVVLASHVGGDALALPVMLGAVSFALLPWRVWSWALLGALIAFGTLALCGGPGVATAYYGAWLLLTAPLVADAAGTRRPRSIFGPNHVESLLPLSPTTRRRARTRAGVIAALPPSVAGLLVLGLSRVYLHGHTPLPSSLWMLAAAALGWAVTLARARRQAPAHASTGELRPYDWQRRLPTLYPAWLAVETLLKQSHAPVQVQAADVLVDRDWRGWGLGWLLRAAALVAAGVLWYLVHPAAAGTVLLVAAACSLALPIAALSLWPVSWQGELGLGPLLPRAPRQLWLRRFGAAAFLALLAAGIPGALAALLHLLGAAAATPELSRVPWHATRLALGVLAWWPLLALEAVAARFVERVFLLAVFLGAVGALVALPYLERAGVSAGLVALLWGPVLAVLSYRYCDANGWPVVESRGPLVVAWSRAFWLQALLGIGAVHAIWFLLGG